MRYYKFEEEDVEKYIKTTGFFENRVRLFVKEIGTGNMNYVFQVEEKESGKKLILKQAVPYARCVGKSFPMSLDRIMTEANAMELQNRFACGTVPKLYHKDKEMALIIMEDLSDFDVMRDGLRKRKRYSGVAEDIATFMANMSFYTSNLYLDSEKKRQWTKEFANENLIKITEDVIFTDPFYDCERNRINPEIMAYVKGEFWNDKWMQLEAAKLRYKFMTESQSLVHGDLHTGSIFVKGDKAKVFDSEFSFYGPSAFDLGLLTAHFILNYVSWSGKEVPANDVTEYRGYLLGIIESIYEKYFEKFSRLWSSEGVNVGARVEGYKEYYQKNLFSDALGYAAVVVVRRILGLTHVEDIDEIEDLKKRGVAQLLGLELSKELLRCRHEVSSIGQVTEIIKDFVY
jgi:5-methylthioribose kinase